MESYNRNNQYTLTIFTSSSGVDVSHNLPVPREMEISREYVSDYSAYKHEFQRCNETVLAQPHPNDAQILWLLLFKENLGVIVLLDLINRSYVLGPTYKKLRRVQTIVTLYRTRAIVMQEKNKLKDNANETLSTEDVIKSRYDQIHRLRELKKHDTIHSFWTQDVNTSFKEAEGGRVYCNATWDTMQCWAYQLAGTTAHQKCPGYVTLSNPTVYSTKTCYPNGTWFRHPETGEVWTNYTICFDEELMAEHQRVLSIYYYGFGLSIILLVISMLIFSCFRQLQCVRVTLHKHLFFSYVLSGVMWILYYSLVSSDLDVLRKNEPWCQALHVITHYTTVCSYAWMFCEGFYLHALIVITFVKDTRLIHICYIIGWLVPIIPCLIYTALRANDQDGNKRCWTDETLLNWILAGPVSVSLILNLGFSVNIMRILISKLRSVQNNETQQTRRAVKATLILIPLLGLQYIAFPFKPDPGDRGEYEYSMTSAFFVSFQGVFVSLVFCFFNGEVLSLIKRFWQDFKDRLNPRHHKSSRRKSTTSSYILQEMPLTSSRHNSSGKVGRKQPLPETHNIISSKEICLEAEEEDDDSR